MARLGSFQTSKFDPLLLTSQIFGFQSFLYFTLSILLLIGLSFLDINLSLSAIFDFRVSQIIGSHSKHANECIFSKSM
jgi:Integral membrane protein S linking to the trans Golgi network